MKLTRSHTTTTEASNKVIIALEKMGGVAKISRGPIKNTRGSSGQKSIKIADVQSGLKISVRGNGAVQDLYIYTNSPDAVKEMLKNIF